ncbi:MAG: c-type cytochrome, partial [Steroidobacter sp.]
SPGPLGAHNWFPMSFSPQTKLAYIPALDSSSYYKHDDAFELRERTWNTGISISRDPANAKTVEDAARSKNGAMLIAWDPVAQREVWRVKYQRLGNGGVLTTGGGLVFQGSVDNLFNAYDADTGARLWSGDAQNAILGGPVTFELDGEQYIATLAGIGGAAVGGLGGTQARSPFGRVLAFKLGGKARLPALLASTVRRPPDVRRANAIGDIQSGRLNYHRVCSACHGAAASSTTAIPDLRYSSTIANRDAFKSVVIDGVRADKGMVGFGSTLTAAQAEEIRAYLVSLAVAL